MPTERYPVTTQLAARSLSVPVPDKGFDSPITELIAAIEAEQARVEKPNRAAAPPPARHRVLRQLPERQRVVQQLPERPAPPQPAPWASHFDLSLDPLLTKLFGPDDRALPQPRRGPAQPRAQNGHVHRLAANAARRGSRRGR